MTKEERNWIARVQLAQLAADETYEKDYYCRRFQARKQAAPTASKSVKISSKEDDGHGYERLLAEAKAWVRPKATQLAVEGALGHIAINSLRNPKQLLHLKTQPKPPTSQQTEVAPHFSNDRQRHGKSIRRRVLQAVEVMYDSILFLEDLYGQWEANKPTADDSRQSEWYPMSYLTG